MTDIFISYTREEQDKDKARQLAVALEKQGWSVWWDPKLRAGDYFDDVIEKALNEARCVIVMWSKRSVQSRYVRDESSYALDCGKLVPVAIRIRQTSGQGRKRSRMHSAVGPLVVHCTITDGHRYVRIKARLVSPCLGRT